MAQPPFANLKFQPPIMGKVTLKRAEIRRLTTAEFYGNSAFLSASVRRDFLFKTYMIIFVQFAFATFLSLLFVYVRNINEFALKNPNACFWLLFIIFCVITITSCCPILRLFPISMFLLMSLTGLMTGVCALASVYYQVETLWVCLAVLAIVSVILSLYAAQPWIEYTATAAFLLSVTLILILFTIVLVYLPVFKVRNLIFGCYGSTMWIFYVIVDMQLIMGGYGRSYNVEPDDPGLAALTVYIDILNLLFFILITVSPDEPSRQSVVV